FTVGRRRSTADFSQMTRALPSPPERRSLRPRRKAPIGTGDHSFDCRVAWWPSVGHGEAPVECNISGRAARKNRGARVTPGDDATVFVIDDDSHKRAATPGMW